MAKLTPGLLLLVGVLATLARGDEKQAAPPPAETAASARDPFWPVSYVPQASPAGRELNTGDLLQITNLSPEEQALIKARLRVGGILQQNRQRFAIINKQVVKKGDSLTVELSGHTYDFVIRALEEKNIVLEPVESNATEPTQPEGATP